MTFADMVVARALLKHLTDRHVDVLLDALEDPTVPLPRDVERAIRYSSDGQSTN